MPSNRSTAGRPSPPPSGISRNSFPLRQIAWRRPISTTAGPAWRRPRSVSTSPWSSARKAIHVEPRHLAARFLIARIHDKGLGDLEAAVAGYKKVIALSGYDGQNEHCVAARDALDALVHKG